MGWASVVGNPPLLINKSLTILTIGAMSTLCETPIRMSPINDILHPVTEDKDSSDKAVAAKAVELLRQESSKELISSLPLRNLAKVTADKPAVVPQSLSYLQTCINAGTSQIISNDDARTTVNQLSSDLVKTAILFTGGKLG